MSAPCHDHNAPKVNFYVVQQSYPAIGIFKSDQRREPGYPHRSPKTRCPVLPVDPTTTFSLISHYLKISTRPAKQKVKQMLIIRAI